MSADVLLSRETPDGDRLEFGAPETFVPRTTPFSVPRSSADFYGYAEQRSRLTEFVARGVPATVGIWGPGGAGKTELLARIAAIDAGAWPDGRVLLSVRDAAPEDIVALLCDAVFEEADPRERPSGALCAAALAQRKMLVALDDLRSPSALAAVQSALTQSLLVITTPQPWNAPGIEWVGLQGLTVDGVRLLQEVADGDVPTSLALDIVHRLEGNPGRIARAARLGVPLETIVASCSSAQSFDDFSLARAKEMLSPQEQLALAAAATFGEAAFGAEGPPASLVRAGFLERSAAGWAVPDGLRERAAELEQDAGLLATALLQACSGQGRASLDALGLLAATPGLLAVVECDGVPASQAAKLVATLLERHGLWAAAGELCEALRVLSRKLEDPATWAWAMHQLGARRACLGDAEGARALFAGALAARQFNSDEPGCAVTVANLALLSGNVESAKRESPVPPAPSPAVRVGPAHESEPEVVLLPPLRETAPSQAQPARLKKSGTPPLAIGLSVVALGAVVALVLWLALRQSDEQQFANASASASPRTTQATTPAAQASAPLAAPAAVVPVAAPHAKPRAPAPATAVPPRPTPAAVAPQVLPPATANAAVSRAATARAPSALRKSRKKRQAGKPEISMLTLLPPVIGPHELATLCVSADNAEELYVSGVGRVPPDQTTCRSVGPAATTTYEAQAFNQAWRTTRKITLQVTQGGVP